MNELDSLGADVDPGQLRATGDIDRAVAAFDNGTPFGAYAHLGRFDPPSWKFEFFPQFSGTDAWPPDRYAAAAQGWRAQGARVIGGCCGAGPDHVRAMKAGNRMSYAPIRDKLERPAARRARRSHRHRDPAPRRDLGRPPAAQATGRGAVDPRRLPRGRRRRHLHQHLPAHPARLRAALQRPRAHAPRRRGRPRDALGRAADALARGWRSKRASRPAPNGQAGGGRRDDHPRMVLPARPGARLEQAYAEYLETSRASSPRPAATCC